MQVIATVVVAAIRYNDHGAAFVFRLAIGFTHAQVNSIKKRSALIGGGKQQRESPLNVLLVAGEGHQTLHSSSDPEHGKFVAICILYQVRVENRESRFLDEGHLTCHA